MALKGSLKRTSLLTKVSHHPPISACHAESENFIFWQGEVGSWWGGPGGQGQMAEGLEHSPLLSLLSLSFSQPNSRHEVEEQVLGQIPGDCACGNSQCQPTQVSVPKLSAPGPVYRPSSRPGWGGGRDRRERSCLKLLGVGSVCTLCTHICSSCQ